MKHSPHTMLFALLVVALYVLVAARADLLAVGPVVACTLMIAALVWMAARPRRR